METSRNDTLPRSDVRRRRLFIGHRDNLIVQVYTVGVYCALTSIVLYLNQKEKRQALNSEYTQIKIKP